jgi:kynurenine formamidase
VSGLPEFQAVFDRLSNWGRWGVSDQAGTLNLLTPEAVRAAASTVQTGQRVHCARALKIGRAATPGAEFLHHMLIGGEEAAAVGMSSTADWFAMGIHGYDSTHLDSPAHIVWNGTLFNGIDAGQISTSRGALSCSVDLAVDGIIGQGILVDGPAIKGRPWLEPGETLDRPEVEGWCEDKGITLNPGSIVAFRFGRDEAERNSTSILGQTAPGITLACAEWFREHDVAVLMSDAISDTMPSPVPEVHLPIHALTIASMGMWIVDNADLGSLARACADHSRWAFLLSIQPLHLKRSTGSPVTPLAIF